MTVERLTRLFEALGNPASKNPSIVKATAQSLAAGSSQAVRLAPDFGTQQSVSAEDRATKVAQIKADVEAGTYKPDSKEVARALVRDLFVA
jgi:anti-sigma28 factor (negative regulator of flagellin synthesis)